MSDLPFGLESRNSHAALSPADLQSLGKRASISYLSGEGSLNDAIIKLARQYPSISSHQVRRIVEHANQETFAKLFANNEKYASDKNVEFDVADPGAILHEINSDARPFTMTAPSSEYGQMPVKVAHDTSAVEADLALTKMFLGVDFASEGTEKTAAMVGHHDDSGNLVIDRILDITEQAKTASPLDNILGAGKEKAAFGESGLAPQDPMAQAITQGQPAPGQPQQGGEMTADTHHEQMLNIQREIELAKKREELQKIQQKTIQQMAPGMEQGQAEQADPNAMAAQQQQAGPVEAAPPQEMPAPAEGAIMAPPGSEYKTASALTKQAMSYVKSGRPSSDLVLADLQSGVSLTKVKEAVAKREESTSYPMANPHGELIRMKQKLAKQTGDALAAKDKNAYLLKEARDSFIHECVSHLDAGAVNFGSLTDLLSGFDTQEGIKLAFEQMLIPAVAKKGYNLTKLASDTIRYEMEHQGRQRVVNINHPIVSAFSTMKKLAEAQPVLEETWSSLKSQHDAVDAALGGVLARASSM